MMSTIERVKKVMVGLFDLNAETITESTAFVDDVGLDSLDTIELIMSLEEEFGIVITDDAAEDIVTVGDAVKHIDEAQ
jgi:acyl carrier protein